MTLANVTADLDSLREGIAAARGGNKLRAREVLRQATRAEPRNELAWLWLAGVVDSPEEALDCLQRVLRLNPKNDQARQGLATTWLQIGIADAKAGRKRTARRRLLEVTKINPDHELAWLWLGGVAEAPHEAIQCLQRVLEINPSNGHARNGLKSLWYQAAISEAHAGNPEAARGHFRQLISDEPSHELAWLGLAEVAESPRETIHCLEQVLAINPDSARARESLLWYQGRVNLAANQWQCPLCEAKTPKPLTEQCDQCGALLNLADVEVFQGHEGIHQDRLERAQTRLRKSAQARPQEFSTWYHLGLVALNLGRFDEAWTHFQKASDLLPAHQAVHAMVEALEQHRLAAEETGHQQELPAVLVVDDSPTVRKLVTITLEKEGYRVQSAADATEAVNLLAKGLPGLILLDITMPGTDGYQLCKLLKSDPYTAHVPVVMLSGKDSFFDKLRGRIAGSTEYITKPFKPEALIEVALKHCVKA